MTVQPNPQPAPDPKPGDIPPTPPNPVSAHLPGPPQPDRLELAMKAKDDAITSLKSSVELLNQSVGQKDEMITQQQTMISQLRDSFQAAQDFAAERLGVETPAAQPKPAAPAPQQGTNIAELQKMLQGVVAQQLQPFAQSVVNMQAHHDRTIFERRSEVRLNDDQHVAVLEIQRKYANMPYDDAIRHLPQDLQIQASQKVVQASQIPPPEPTQPEFQPPAEPQIINRLPRQPAVQANPTAPTSGPAVKQPGQRAEEGIYSLKEVGAAMKEATAKGDFHARDEMGAKAISALMVDGKGNPLFPRTSVAAK